MRDVDVVIVGGGPAGSTCARELIRRGVNCVVLDRAAFPRLKLCAGWITPDALEDLELDAASYPGSFLTFEELQVHWGSLRYGLRSRQHSIRRLELDAWLLARAGAPVVRHQTRRIVEDADRFVIDDAFRCRWLVGAGGTACPVYRELFRDLGARPERMQAAVLEEEFAHDAGDRTCRLWFFERGLPGYSWYVPKAGGHLNVGVGGMTEKLRGRGQRLRDHWGHLTGRLAGRGLVADRTWDPGGYTYYCRSDGGTARRGRALLCGDAAGLATRDMFEGIGPAVRSGLAAARTIIDGRDYDLSSVSPYSCPPGLMRRALEHMFVNRRY